MSSEREVYGYLAEFASSRALLDAVREIRRAGYRGVDAYAPMPVEGLAEALGSEADPLPLLVLLGAVGGGAGFFLLEYLLAVVNYAHDVGGRPVFSWPAFVFPAIEMSILTAVLFGFAGMLVLDRLPRLNHPLFDVPAFDRATRDRYFVCIRRSDPRFEPSATRTLLDSLAPERVHEVAE